MLRAGILLFFFTILLVSANARDITFCGENIPVSKDFVAQKLMNVIRDQIPNANLSSLRKRALKYFPYIEACLKKNGIPEDFKYLPIVESGFANLASNAGARGFWQLLPGTAMQFNLLITSEIDERDDPVKATQAACQMILQTYKVLKKNTNSSSWILTAAAYNFGVGNVMKAVRSQGKDYFTMQLNDETAEYVYKIIAIKELFENPELYMGSFGINVFRPTPAADKTNIPHPIVAGEKTNIKPEFASLNIKISKTENTAPPKPVKTAYVAAHVAGNYSKFQDGDLIALVLDNTLDLHGEYTAKGNTIKGTGWIIDDRVYIDLGYGHSVQVFDASATKGIKLSDIKPDTYVLLKTEINDD